jgi:hypothetical protein
MMLSPILKAFLYLVLLVSLPLLGAWWAGQPLTPYLGFPPKPWPVAEVPFSWTLFWGYLVLELPVFWEMWNSLSCPKWVYTVPFVSRFKLFEMPILGYAGYLPFGLECALVVDFWSN